MDATFHPTVEGRSTFVLTMLKNLYEPWAYWLTTHELAFMMYLFMHSVAKGKPNLKASYNDMVYGAFADPIKMSKSKLISVIKSCVEKGAVRVVPGDIDGTPSTYTIDLRWNQAPIV